MTYQISIQHYETLSRHNQVLKKKAQLIARTLGMYQAARYLCTRFVPLQVALRWLLHSNI